MQPYSQDTKADQLLQQAWSAVMPSQLGGALVASGVQTVLGIVIVWGWEGGVSENRAQKGRMEWVENDDQS
jgi:hypothetical protein